MRRRYLVILMTIAVGATAYFANHPAEAQKPVANRPESSFRQTVAPLLAKYCTQCHGGKRPKGELSLEHFKNDDDARAQPAIWDKVAQNLRSGDMPPQGKPRPTPQELQAITSW